MAMITCPECGKEISDTAAACPNCGYAMKPAAMTVDPVPLPEMKKHPIAGAFCIIVGILGFLLGILTVGVIIGIFMIIGSLMFFAYGVYLIKGCASCPCPYCGTKRLLTTTDTAFKCSSCKKSSVIRDGCIHPADNA